MKKITLSEIEQFVKKEVSKLEKITILENEKKKLEGELVLLKEEKDPKAAVRNKSNPVFDAKSSSVTDDKDHFPLGSEDQARNALARASQYKSVPSWYKGSLESLVGAVQKAVKKAYPSIETTEKSKNPGKG